MLNSGVDMKAITEEFLMRCIKEVGGDNLIRAGSLVNLLEEIDILPLKEPDLILAAEKYAEKYNVDDRQDIKIDVLNAFYHGAEWVVNNNK